MKGKFMFALAAVGMLALTSCKSDWDCECEFTNPVTDDTESAIAGTIQDATESDAEEVCDDLESLGNTGGIDDYSCTLTEK